MNPHDTRRCNGADCEVCRCPVPCILNPQVACVLDDAGKCMCERPQPVGFWSAFVEAMQPSTHEQNGDSK